MKILGSAFIIVLLIALFNFKYESLAFQRQNKALKENIQALNFQNKAPHYFSLIHEKELKLDDSLLEIHRIMAFYGYRHFLIRMEISKDSSIHTTFKRFTLKNPATGVGQDSLWKTSYQTLSNTTLEVFKSKLSKVDFYKAIAQYDIFCCFGGGSISYEAILQSKQRLEFETYCRQSTQFAEACEYIFKQIDDTELKGIMKAQDEAIEQYEKNHFKTNPK